MTIRRIIPLIYTLFVGLRGANVGQDTGVYYQHYYMYGQWGCDFVELGFDWLNRFCYHQGWESWSLFLICAGLSIYPVYLVMNRLGRKEYTISAMFFYCCTFSLVANGMRQVVACGIFFCLISFYFNKVTLKRKDIIIYVAGLGVASLFHISALFLLPVFLLCKVPANKKMYLLLYLFSFVFLFWDFSSYIPEITLGNRDYGAYLENLKVKKASSLGFLFTALLRFIIFYCMYRFDAFNKYRMLSHLVMLSFIFTNMAFNIPIVNRVAMYFPWFVYILISKMYVESRPIKSMKYVFFLIFAMFGVLTIYGIFSPANKLTPYTTYWQNNNYENHLWNEE